MDRMFTIISYDIGGFSLPKSLLYRGVFFYYFSCSAPKIITASAARRFARNMATSSVRQMACLAVNLDGVPSEIVHNVSFCF